VRSHYSPKAIFPTFKCFYIIQPEDGPRGSKHIAVINTKT